MAHALSDTDEEFKNSKDIIHIRGTKESTLFAVPDDNYYNNSSSSSTDDYGDFDGYSASTEGTSYSGSFDESTTEFSDITEQTPSLRSTMEQMEIQEDPPARNNDCCTSTYCNLLVGFSLASFLIAVMYLVYIFSVKRF